MTLPAPVPSDDDIERMAVDIHRAYLAEYEASGGDPDLPAAVTWADLPDDLKAQNRRQARANLRRLVARGIRVIPCVDVPKDRRLGHLDEDLVEALAIEEHDLWYRQKIDQGYVWGERRDDVGPPKTHPDLIAWANLAPEVQEKDRAPMRRILDVLAVGGWCAIVDDG